MLYFHLLLAGQVGKQIYNSVVKLNLFIMMSMGVTQALPDTVHSEK